MDTSSKHTTAELTHPSYVRPSIRPSYVRQSTPIITGMAGAAGKGPTQMVFGRPVHPSAPATPAQTQKGSDYGRSEVLAVDWTMC